MIRSRPVIVLRKKLAMRINVLNEILRTVQIIQRTHGL